MGEFVIGIVAGIFVGTLFTGWGFLWYYEKNIEEMVKGIINPLSEQVTLLQREVKKLNIAIDKAKDCHYVKDCPIVKTIENL